jgi:hypothetical protein
LVVDDFGVKYVGKEHVEHLIKCIKETYEVIEDWTGDLYCGITLKWNYVDQWLGINGIPAKRILPVTRVNTTQGHIILLCARVTYMKIILPWYYQEQTDLAL